MQHHGGEVSLTGATDPYTSLPVSTINTFLMHMNCRVFISVYSQSDAQRRKYELASKYLTLA